MRVSAYLRKLCGFFYAVSCGIALINLHKPQPHMKNNCRANSNSHPSLTIVAGPTGLIRYLVVGFFDKIVVFVIFDAAHKKSVISEIF